MRILPVVAALVVITLALVAGAMSSGASGRSTVTVHGSAYGRILFDGRGFALYAFTRDAPARSRCAGACAKAWPPFLVKGTPRAVGTVKPGLLSTIRRKDGSRQATYAGRPLYHYVGDRRPRQVLCQNVVEFGGRWLVLRPTGALVR